jgi:hypothetical protein
MSRLERTIEKRATQSWRIKTAGAAVITAGFCSTIGAFEMQLDLGTNAITAGLLPTVMVLGVGTVLAGLLFTRGIEAGATASVWLTMALGLGGVVWNAVAYEAVALSPISVAAVACSLVAFVMAPMAWVEMRKISTQVRCAVVY